MSKRRNKAEWRRLIDEQAASGLSRKVFCENAGIALSTFAYWKRKLRCDEPVKGGSLDDWIELTPPTTDPASAWHIELDLGNGVCLRLRRS